MKLKAPKPKPAKPLFNQVRETPAVVKALADEANAVGIPSTEALRQIIADYNANPFTFDRRRSLGRKSGVWDNIKSDQTTIDTFTAHTARHGISVAEGIRQCVRRYLKQQETI